MQATKWCNPLPCFDQTSASRLQALENNLKDQASFWEKKVEELNVQLQQVQQQKDEQQVSTCERCLLCRPAAACVHVFMQLTSCKQHALT